MSNYFFLIDKMREAIIAWVKLNNVDFCNILFIHVHLPGSNYILGLFEHKVLSIKFDILVLSMKLYRSWMINT